MLPHRTYPRLAPCSSLCSPRAAVKSIKSYSELRVVQNELMKRFGEEVSVNATNGQITV